MTPHVAQKARCSAIDGRTTRHAGYALSRSGARRSKSPSVGPRPWVGWRRPSCGAWNVSGAQVHSHHGGQQPRTVAKAAGGLSQGRGQPGVATRTAAASTSEPETVPAVRVLQRPVRLKRASWPLRDRRPARNVISTPDSGPVDGRAATLASITIAKTIDQPAAEILEVHRCLKHFERVAMPRRGRHRAFSGQHRGFL